ncbi:MAG: hypothetical protein ACRC77_01495 [Bacteroidales bacterium]
MRIRNILSILKPLVKCNTEIIFANKFIWFLLTALLVFLGTMFISAWDVTKLEPALLYRLLLFPGILLIFYPTTFSIQNDEDAKMMEIIFGIPNYRFKVWLVRLIFVYLLVTILLIGFTQIGSVLLYKVSVLHMSFSVLLPILFLGNLAFMFSTIVRSGSGTAVIMIVIGLLFFVLSNNRIIENSMWDIFLNPYKEPNGINPAIWNDLILKNRLVLSIGSIIFVLVAMLNLQRRERFV